MKAELIGKAIVHGWQAPSHRYI